MESFLIYLFKSTGVLFLFYGCYYLLLRKETFFSHNRWFLLLGLLLTVALPWVYITRTVYLPIGETVIETLQGTEAIPASAPPVVRWELVFFCIYLLGALVCVCRLFFQLGRLVRIFANCEQEQHEGLVHFKSKNNVKPFSFFRNIVYNPSQYNPQELRMILAHEEVHARKGHSFDILCMELLIALHWFNPVVWYYRRALKENLEFLADTQNATLPGHKKQYQYILLKETVDKDMLSIINPFFNSLIKKRIVMMNKEKSSSRNLIKYSFVVPLLAAFLLLFNTKTEAKLKPLATTPNATVQKHGEIVYSISKHTTDAEISALIEEIKANKGVLKIEKLERNTQGEIISLAIKYELPGQFVTGNTADENGIATIFFGILETGGVFYSTNEDGLVEINDYTPPSNGKYKTNSISVQSPNLKLHLNGGEEKTILDVDGKEPLIVLDGKVISKTELDSLYPEKIANMSVLKGEAAIKKHGPKAKNGVIEITSKTKNGIAGIQVKGNANGEIPLYILDGSEITKQQMEKLDQERIKSVDVLKSEKAIQKYGEKGKNGVIVITTKEN